VEMSQIALNLSTPDAHTAILPSTHGCPSVQLTKKHLRGSCFGRGPDFLAPQEPAWKSALGLQS
jgi:hypothetical protein